MLYISDCDIAYMLFHSLKQKVTNLRSHETMAFFWNFIFLISSEGLWSRIPYYFFRSAVKTFCTVSAKHIELTDDQYDMHCSSLLSNLRVLQKMYDVSAFWIHKLFYGRLFCCVICSLISPVNLPVGQQQKPKIITCQGFPHRCCQLCLSTCKCLLKQGVYII